MNSWHSYPSIYNLGHRAITNLLAAPVNVEEKVDGSQFSFGVDENGEIHARSKGAVLIVDAPEKMFLRAVETVKEISANLIPGWTYRGEYLQKPKHNTLAYSRTPANYIVVFDINSGEEEYLSYEAKKAECDRIGLECIPLIYSGIIASADILRSFLDRESYLGGQKIEGVVVKPKDYAMFGLDKKLLIGKFVSEAFKEVHSSEWKKSNPTSRDILDQLGAIYRTPARWNKAIQHMSERGQLTGTPKDIGALLKETSSDVYRECEEEIKDRLFKWAWPHIARKVIAGFPEWYKNELLEKQFEAGGN